MIKCGDITQAILLCLITRWVVFPMNAFLCQATKDTLHNSIVPTVAFTTHATKWLALSNRRYCLLAYWSPQSECTTGPRFGLRCPVAILNASQTNFAFILESILQPTTLLEHRSITTAKDSQPAWVQLYEISCTYTWWVVATSNGRFKTLSKTASLDRTWISASFIKRLA